ncbi:hypothetical protein [Sphingomonas sp. 3-13AW]|uniref:hypothetical protein n=1 Tax=Sphingomonas sp. 3-13AW TaxID=3050450 RepID=UPI003BB66E66
MPLTAEQWDEISSATNKLRSLGCAVCIFTQDDVEAAAEGEDIYVLPDHAAKWLSDNRTGLEDGMATYGNGYISDNLALEAR